MARHRALSPAALVAATLAASASIPAYAQEPDEETRDAVLEVGVQAAAIVAPGWRQVVPGARLGMPVARRLFFEVDAAWAGMGGAGDATQAIYVVQLRRAFELPDSRRTSIFLIGGGAGWIERSTVGSTAIRAPDGTIVESRPQRNTALVLPVLPTIGAGLQHQLSSHAALRLEGLLHLGVYDDINTVGRISAGLSFLIGGR